MNPRDFSGGIRKRTRIASLRSVAALAAVALALVAGGVGIAQSADVFDLRWSTTGAGNAEPAKGGSYSLLGNVGHTAAGELAGGGYTLNEGFLSVILTTSPKVNAIPAITWWGLSILASLIALALTGRTMFSRWGRRPIRLSP